MQIIKESYPMHPPPYFNVQHNYGYPLECYVAIPVEINNIIFTVWHTKIFSIDATCLAIALITDRYPPERNLEITQAFMRTSVNQCINEAYPNSSDVLCFTTRIKDRSKKPLSGATTRMAFYLSRDWPDRETAWQFYLMHTFNIYHNQKLPLRLSITSARQAKQLELLLSAARESSTAIPLCVISFLLDALELSNDAIMWITLQHYTGLLSTEIRWQQLDHLLPGRSRNDPVPTVVQTSIPIDKEGDIMAHFSYPPLSQAALRQILTSTQYDDRVINALVEPALLSSLVLDWKDTFLQQRATDARRSQQYNTPTSVTAQMPPTHSTSPMPSTSPTADTSVSGYLRQPNTQLY